MSVLVNPKNEQEEKVLLAFLDSLRCNYQADIENTHQLTAGFVDQYNSEIAEADAAIEAGHFVSHDDVEHLFKIEEKRFNGY